MSTNVLNIATAEQLAAEAIAGAIISQVAGSDAQKRVSAANSAIEAGKILNDIAVGDVTSALTALQANLNTSNIDPAIASAINVAMQAGLQQAAIVGAIGSFVPLLGSTGVSVMQNLSIGLIAAGNAEIAKYGPKPEPTPAPAA